MTTTTKPRPYIEPTPESGRALVMRGIKGQVVMLNLLRFRDIADYAATPELAPDTPISGAAAFERYIAHTLPLLRASGGDLLFLDQGHVGSSMTLRLQPTAMRLRVSLRP